MSEPLLEVRNLKKYFPVKTGFAKTTQVKAVDDVSFTVNAGETVSIVGESGCGKSTTGRAIMQLDKPTAGQIIFNGVDLMTLSKSDLRKTRGDIQMIFQDPFASLNPRQTVYHMLNEVMAVQGIGKNGQRREKIKELLATVGLLEHQIDLLPHQFSGGQRQRIGIARALAANPKLIVCDEAVSALDVSIQAQVLNLLKDLQKELNLTYLFISHDLGVVRHISDKIIVMYLGKVMEISESEALFNRPRHPYTKALLSAIPTIDFDNPKEKLILQGDVPTPLDPPTGCPFHTRCPFAIEACKQTVPAVEPQKDDPTHGVACIRTEEIA
ncbi:MAG: dipeptide ABC transporter ATP-binding protein [Defluviitaleaceae bacterium]|nr:dipeptide ABC transporter ATP-binding protein [Defluviitaleaceae bacterium]